MFNLIVVRSLFSLLIVGVVAGCATPQVPVASGDTHVTIAINVAADINPDEDNQPSPLFIRMYQLRSDELFNSADFLDIYERDKDILGADLLRKEELKAMIPGQNHLETFVADKQTRYIALYAEFFRYKNSNYKVVFPVTADHAADNQITISISANNMVRWRQP